MTNFLLNAEGAKVTQKSQKKPERIKNGFFCVFCEISAPSAFKKDRTPANLLTGERE